jgi:uracil-DNA glycosylase
MAALSPITAMKTEHSAQKINLPDCWKAALGDIFESPNMQALREFLRAEKAAGQVLYPPMADVFNALRATPLAEVKAVILGQDPYPGAHQAHGLCFSVKPGIAVPRSLANIYQELHNDIGFQIPRHGCLQAWAERGVLLLNAVLTVRAGQADSHKNKGWESFTDRVVQVLNESCESLVFLLWGRNAQQKGAAVDAAKHAVLRAAHPSPLSAHQGFFGCRHFSKTNQYLQMQGKQAIDWQLPMQA